MINKDLINNAVKEELQKEFSSLMKNGNGALMNKMDELIGVIRDELGEKLTQLIAKDLEASLEQELGVGMR